MTLKDCTKEELIFVIERLQFYGIDSGDYYVRRALSDVEERRDERKIERMRRLTKLADAKNREYTELLAPYEGQPFINIPDEVLRKADAAQKECRAANLEWFKLAGIKIRK